MKTRVIVFLILIACVSFMGCGMTTKRDVSNREPFFSAYVGRDLEVLRPSVVWRFPDGARARGPSVTPYRLLEESWPTGRPHAEKFFEVPPGSMIHVTRIIRVREYGLMGMDWKFAICRISGPDGAVVEVDFLLGLGRSMFEPLWRDFETERQRAGQGSRAGPDSGATSG